MSGYRLDVKAAPYSFKPYDRIRARRDIRDAGIVSRNLSRHVAAQPRAARREGADSGE